MKDKNHLSARQRLLATCTFYYLVCVCFINNILNYTQLVFSDLIFNIASHHLLECILIPSIRKLSDCRMSKKALVFLAPGTEEMEFVIAADVLVRGGIEVTIAGLPDSSLIKCSRGVNIKPDIGIAEAKSKGPFDVLVLPGGLGGSKAMAESNEVGELLKEQEKAGRTIAAICAAPTALKAHGVALGKNVTSYPSTKDKMLEGGQYNYKEDKVVVDGNVITSRGPGTAYDFALTIVCQLVGKEKASEVAKGLLWSC